MALPGGAGGGNDPIEEVAVQLTIDASDAIVEIEKGIEDAVEETEKFDEALEGISKRAQEIGKEFSALLKKYEGVERGQFGALADFQKLHENTEFVLDELLDFADVYDKQVATVIENAWNRIADAAEAAGLKIDKATEESLRKMLETTAETSETLEEGEQAVNSFADAAIEGLQKTKAEASPMAQIFNDAKSAVVGYLKKFAVVALIIKGLQMINQVVREGIKLTLEYDKALSSLSIQVRRYQRIQGEAAGSIGEWKEFAEEIVEKFGGDLTQTYDEIAEAVSRLGTQLSLNKQQIRDVITAGIALNKTNGDITGSSEVLADFIQTGYTDALRNLGLQYSEALFEQTAFGLGILKSKNDMSEAEKQLVRYQIILDQTNGIVQDAADLQNTLAGRAEEASEKMVSGTENIGRIVTPIWISIKEVVGSAFEAFGQLVTVIGILAVNALSAFGAVAIATAAVLGELRTQMVNLVFDGEKLANVFDTTYLAAFKTFEDVGLKMIGFTEDMGDAFGEPGPEAENMAMQVNAAFEDISKAMDKLNQDLAQGMEDARTDLNRTMEDLARASGRRRADMELDLQRDLQRLEQQGAVTRMGAIRESQIEEIRLREDFLRDIRDLENRFLLDLEDAVRERDARQVLMLQRRFNLEKRKREGDFRLRQKRIKEDLALELKQVQEQVEIRRELRLQAFLQEIEDQQESDKRKIEDARRAYQRQLDDLRLNHQRRIETIFAGITNELKLTNEGLRALFDMLMDAYGPGGWVEAFMNRYYQMLSGFGTSPTASATPGGRRIGGESERQRGAINEIFTAPTMLLVGERPELVNVSPLSAGTGDPIAGFGGRGGEQTVMLDISLDSGLIASIIDEGLEESAAVIANITRNTHRGR